MGRPQTEAGTNGRDIPASIDKLRSLRCVEAVARAGSTKRGGDAVHLSQPAVTRAIQKFEHDQDVRLFDRCARGMMPTVMGKRVAARTQALLNHLRQGVLDAAGASARDRLARRFTASVEASGLKALYVLARTGSEASAGAALGISQPAIHQALRRLQDRAGLRLLQTSPRGTLITEAGETLVRAVKLAMHEARALDSEIAVWRGEFRGQLIIGVLPLSIGPVLADATERVAARHPAIKMTIVEGTYSNLSGQLSCADIDILVGPLREAATTGLFQGALYSDELAIVARVGHPCLSRTATLRSLARWDWVAPLSGTPASVAFERVFAAERVRAPSAPIRASSGAFIRSLIGRSDRLTLLLRRQALDDERAGVLKVVPLRLRSTFRTIGFTVREGAFLSPEVVELTRALHEAAAPYQ